MNFLKSFRIMCLVTALTFSASAFCGNEGGGGMVVACYNNGELKRVQLLDLYEGESKGLVFQSFSGNFHTDVFSIAFKIKKNQTQANQLAERIIMLTNSYKFIPSDSELVLTNDALPTFLPVGCKIKQVANYYNDSLIWIDEKLFNKMSYQDQLALALHEYLYSEEREFSVSNSRYTRTITSLAMSTLDPFTMSNFEKATYHCSSGNMGSIMGKIVFFANREDDRSENLWTFDFTYLNGHKIFSKKTVMVGLANKSPLGDFSTPEEGQVDPSFFRFSTGNIESEINSNEMILVKSNANEILVSWKGTDPGDRFQDVKVTCSVIPK
jgi:hypothetical protein